MIPNEYKEYLIKHGAKDTPHSGSNLWNHLIGVHRILLANSAHEHICVAGLFHSIYGTVAFEKTTVSKDRRTEIQKLIGERAEELVWSFCSLPRPQLLENSLRQQNFHWLIKLEVRHSRQDFRQALLQLECANLLEQNKLYQFRFLVRHAQELGMLDREGFSV